MNTGDLLTELLLAYGTDVVFGVPGGQIVALIDAIHRRQPRIRHVTMRDERSTAFAADAYARLTHRVGVCAVTVGPGTVKLPSGLMESYNASVPILAIVGDINRDWYPLIERGAATQATDQEELLRPLTKRVARLNTPAQLPEVLGTLLRAATSGRPGPVALIIPHDVFDERFAAESIPLRIQPEWGRFPSSACAPAESAVEVAAQRLVAAERPVMIAGGGALLARAGEEVRELVELLTMPVVTTFTGRGVLEDDHPLSLGLLGNIGTRCARAAVEAADVVLLVGFKSAQNSTFGWRLPRPDQTVIHLDIDPEEIGKVFATEIGLVGDARLGLAALAGAVREDLRGRAPARSDARERIAAWKRQWEAEVAPRLASREVPLLPQRIMAELRARARWDDLVVCDASYATGWGALYWPQQRPGRALLAPRGSAGLGYSLPAAIGAAVAGPERRVFVLAGDGGFAYSLGEMATLTLYGLAVKCVVFNNRSLAWIDHWHRIYFGANGEPFRWNDVDFAAIARGFGLFGRRVAQPEEIGPALDAALAAEGSAVVECICSGEETPIAAYEEALIRGHRVTYGGAEAEQEAA
ncbi:MAG: thiamine pyrophosphate-binding protein [Armatimonadetes bacterium]|nr:thiamine pyrophosphate-binding protein [Armatimonadota bacterium]